MLDKGHYRSYASWWSMKHRCFSPKSDQFKYYGARGITVCRRWLKFSNFLADMGYRPEGSTLNRIDNEGNYEPRNCNWATGREQQANRRGCRFIVFNGKRKVLRHWAEELGMAEQTLLGRLQRGWPLEKAMTTPVTMNRANAKKAWITRHRMQREKELS